MHCGYAYLVEKFGISALSLTSSAEISTGVNKLFLSDTGLIVPPRMAPTENDILGHLLFAVKHEGINLEVLTQVLPRVEGEKIQSALEETPGSVILRKLAWLWEETTQKQLKYDNPAGNYVEFFDSNEYFTGPIQRIQRWRILYNGLGPLAYCPTVRKNDVLNDACIRCVFEKLKDHLDTLPKDLIERATQWAYLSETQSSFEIEKEKPSGSKAQRFVDLLKQADHYQNLNEDVLCSIQNLIVSSIYAQAVSYRTEQNWLANARGSLGVTYVPPAPEVLDDLMSGFCAVANAQSGNINPLIAAAVVSFGFVYLHPFMDGNGRLSRFLIHQQLLKEKAIPSGNIVPISATLLKNEADYLDALEGFSTPCRKLWDVMQIDEASYDFHFKANDAVYRYWDATSQCEFLLEMIRKAVEVDLPEEIRLLQEYDRIYRDLNSRFDVVQKDLNLLVSTAVSTGRVSNNLKKKYEYKVEPGFFEELEKLVSGRPNEETTSA